MVVSTARRDHGAGTTPLVSTKRHQVVQMRCGTKLGWHSRPQSASEQRQPHGEEQRQCGDKRGIDNEPAPVEVADDRR
jgi:hypothetical protein